MSDHLHSERIPSSLPFPQRPSVLVVDDEPQVLLALEDILAPRFTVHSTHSPEEALERVRTRDDIAVVISDQRMPKMEGSDLFGRLSDQSRAERILVTGYTDLSAIIKAVNEGRIFAYVTKPWDPEDLQLKVYKAAEHFRLARELAYERQLLNDLMDNVPDGIYFKDPELRFLRVNKPIASLLNGGHPGSLVGKRLSDLSRDAAEVSDAEAEERIIMAKGMVVADKIREHVDGGSTVWLSETKAPVRDASGAAIGLVGISRDVTDRVQAEHARERQQARIRRLTRIHAMLSGINGAIVRIRQREPLIKEACRIAVRQGRLAFATIVTCEAQASRFRVVAFDAPEGALPSADLLPGQHLTEGQGFLARAVKSATPVVANDIEGEAGLGFSREFTSGGHHAVAAFPLFVAAEVQHLFVLSSNQVGFFDDDEVHLLSELADNISFALDHIEKTARLDFLACYDELTGLPNSQLLLDRLGQQLATCRSVGKKLGVVLLDLNRFRQVNEVLGRRGGDALLRDVAARLQGRLDERDSLARLDGNRFAVLVTLLGDESEVASLVEHQLLSALQEAFIVDGTEVRVSARAGVSLFPSDGGEPESLIANAEAALSKAKSQGDRCVFYARNMNARVAERLTLETKLRRALERDEFVLYYQPKVELRSRTVVGLEALIRWQSPEDGLVTPGVFVPILEEMGLISEVGQWVLARAAAQVTEWTAAGISPPRVAVNVSAMQLRRPTFERALEEVYGANETSVRTLDLEITESVFMEDLTGNIEKLSRARAMGLRVAIDDFGTGYSSLSYLSRLPIDLIKIDRSFIVQMTRDPQDMALVTTIISLAHALECEVVAEGVENAEEAQLLHLLKCDQIQGYLVGKPQPPRQVSTTFQATYSFS